MTPDDFAKYCEIASRFGLTEFTVGDTRGVLGKQAPAKVEAKPEDAPKPRPKLLDSALLDDPFAPRKVQ